MEFSGIGRAALKAREGERLTAYRDSVGVWTIGIGITTASGLINVVPGLTITAAQSDDLFRRAVEDYADTVRKALKVKVPQEFFDACVSLCYNIGQPGFSRSTVVQRANAGDLAGAADAFLMWKKPSVIISRRQAERKQALTPYTQSIPYARSDDRTAIKVLASVQTPAASQPVVKPVSLPPAVKTVPATETAPKTSAWSKLGSSLSNFFRRV